MHEPAMVGGIEASPSADKSVQSIADILSAMTASQLVLEKFETFFSTALTVFGLLWLLINHDKQLEFASRPGYDLSNLARTQCSTFSRST
jgi:hypothetical protein